MDDIISTIEYEKLAKAMFRVFHRVFILDSHSDKYVEYLTRGEGRGIEYQTEATDFFNMINQEYGPRVYVEDRALFRSASTRENLLKVLSMDTTFSLVFRLMRGETPEYFRVKAMHLGPEDPSKIIVAVSNVDSQMQLLADCELEKQKSLTYASIFKALASDYICIYYINMETGAYRKYKESPEYKPMHFPDEGKNFFEDGVLHMSSVIHEEDREIFNTAIQKENIQKVLAVDKSFSLTYRMLFQGEWNYISIKATRMEQDGNHHIVVGFTNVNAHMLRLEEYERMRAQSMRFNRIAEALAADFITIYYVNIETDQYLEYRDGKRQGQEMGTDFFGYGRNGLLVDVCEEDRDMVNLDFRKKKVLRELDEQHTYSLIYRVTINGALRYVSMKAAKVQGDKNHIIIGIRNVDDEIKREEDYAHQLSSAHALASTDALTGVKNKLAYAQREEELSRQIEEGSAKPFAILVCDVNGLKAINDTLGHKAGDRYICSACELVCSVFQNSPVYRIGGDEFTVLLQGEDYENREELLLSLNRQVEENLQTGHVVIATGLADYLPSFHQDFSSVFEQADTSMYARKKQLKEWPALGAKMAGQGAFGSWKEALL